MLKIILVRHGEAEGNFNRIFHGHYNSSLTSRGNIQAQRTAEFLDKYKIERLYSSDLKRAADTAGYIAERQKLEINFLPMLREISGGKWENKPWEALEKEFPDVYRTWETNISAARLPGGESTAELKLRCGKEINRIAEENKDKNIICAVTHGTVLRALVSMWKNVPMEEIMWYDNASVTIAEYENGTYAVCAEGLNAHLSGISTFEEQNWWKR